jgi:hypothetical protein
MYGVLLMPYAPEGTAGMQYKQHHNAGHKDIYQCQRKHVIIDRQFCRSVS